MIILLDFRMETLIAVCKYMNFTKAAKELNITQPAVSKHIKFIEEVYGITLFEYEGKKMTLTKDGKKLLEAVTTMKNDENSLKEAFKERKLGKRKLRFVVTRTIGEYVIGKNISKLINGKDNIEMNLKVDNTDVLLKELNNGKIDFAIVEGYFEKTQYDFITFSKERFIAVCSKNNKLVNRIGKEKIFIGDLLGENLFLREEGSGSREIFEKNIKNSNYVLSDFKKYSEISNVNIIKELIIQNCGITFLYEVAVKAELEKGILCEIPLEDFNVIHDFTFIWRKNSVFNEYYKKIYNILKN